MNIHNLLAKYFVCLLLLVAPVCAAAQLTPYFIDEAPADTTVACRNSLPVADSLRAVVLLTEGGLLDTVNVGAINTFSVVSGDCSGEIFRIWTVNDAIGTARDTQVIAYRDTIPPVFALPRDTSLSCSNPPPTPGLTGTVSALSDNCTASDLLEVGFTDTTVVDPTCDNCFLIRRTWTVTDKCDNVNSGVQLIRIADTIPPVARCRFASVAVDPSGLETVALIPSLFDGGSSDNCGLLEASISTATVGCDLIDQTIPITLTVADSSGNVSSCTTTLTVNGITPTPTAGDMVCGGDTLRLFANPPTPSSGGNSPYTFRWFGPLNSLISTRENPVLPQINQNADGPYRVEIRGVTGCTTENVVNVTIGDVPVAPTIGVPATTICLGDPVEITSPSTYAGSVIFRWFRGTPVSSIELDTTTTGFFTTGLLPGAAIGTFYAIVEVNGCASPPSDLVIVRAVPKPVISVAESEVTACQFEDVLLIARGDPGLTYRWTSPTGVVTTGSTLLLSPARLADEGKYTVVAFADENCPSDAAAVAVTILPAPAVAPVLGPAEVCLGTDFELTAGDASGDAFEFTGPSGQVITSASPTITITNAGAGVAGAWSVRVRSGACFSLPGPRLVITLLPEVAAIATASPMPVCEGNDLRLLATNVGEGGAYNWTGPNGFTATGRAPVIPNVTSAASGVYTLNVTNRAGCTDETTIRVDVLQGVRIDSIVAEGNECVEEGEVVTLRAAITPSPGSAAYQYVWTAPDGSTSNGSSLVVSDLGPSANGTYRLVVTNAVGCISPPASFELFLNLASQPALRPFTESADYEFCPSEDVRLRTSASGPTAVYRWEGPNGFTRTTTQPELNLTTVTPDQAGNYTVTVISEGCETQPSAARAIVVTALPVINASAPPLICAGDPIQLSADDVPGVAYAWSGPNGFTSSEASPVIPNANPALHNGQYQLVASRNGCPAEPIILTVMVNPPLARPSLDVVAPICVDLGGGLELSVAEGSRSVGATYTFVRQPGGTVLGVTSEPTLSLTDLSVFGSDVAAQITVTASVAGCESAASQPLLFRLDRTFGQMADAGKDTTVCAGQVFLSAAAPGASSGRWARVPGPGAITIVDPTNPRTPVTGLSLIGSPYQFVWTLSNGSCTNFSTDTVSIAVTATEMADAGDNRIACIGQPLTLNATPPTDPGATGRWTQRQTQALIGVSIINPTDPNTGVTGLRTDNVYTFTWVVEGRCGMTTDDVAVSVSDPNPRAGANQRVCDIDPTVTVQAVAPSLGSTGRWYSAVGEGVTFSNPAGPATSVSNLTPGQNLLVWELDGGVCGDRSRDTLTIRYLLQPAPEDDVVTVPFQGSADFRPADNDDNPADAALEFGGLTPDRGRLEDNGGGSYTFVAPDNFVGQVSARYVVRTEGCPDATAGVNFVVGEEAPCDIPNIFTPNGDGVNDNFIVPCLLDGTAFPSSEVTIYNQWGDEVFRSGQPYRNNWSGTYQGGDLPVGTYFYLVNRGDGSRTMTGDVRIER